MPWGSDILTEPDKSFFRRRLVSKVIETCDHVQCDAEFVKKKIIKDYNKAAEKITVFPWGIDLGQFNKTNKTDARKALKLDNEKFIILYNRYFEPVYGVNYLLDAYREFSAGKDDVMMLMLSDGSGKNDVLRYITEKGLDDKIQLIGRVPNHELPLFLNAADVYVSPSLSDGTSLSLLEAMACGTGLIVTDVPAIMEWVNADNGLIVKKGSTPEIKKALEEYYINRELASTHGARNIEIAKERADWDKNYLKLKEIYTKLLK